MDKRFKVVLTDHVYPDLEYEKTRLSDIGAELYFLDSKDEKEIAAAAADADAVITCYANISALVIAGMTKCRIITKTGIGVNNIDVAAASGRGIRVTNVPDYCIEEVSDHTAALIMALARQVPRLARNVAGGAWNMGGAGSIARLRGRTLGLLGFGKIARRTCEKMQSFGMRILCYDPYVSAEQMRDLNATKAELDEILERAHFVSLNLPLTPETERMADDSFFSKMRSDAYFVNTSRGGLVDEGALLRALGAGGIAGAALDVLNDETRVADNPLIRCDNVIITPHAAYYSAESTQELREKVIADVVAVLGGNPPRYQVNRI